jgi:FdhD protein
LINDLTPADSNDLQTASQTGEEGVGAAEFLSISSGSRQPVKGEVVNEILACISVNGEELTRYMCSPHDLSQLAIGFLYNEGLIESNSDVRSVHVSKKRTCVDIWLQNADFVAPERMRRRCHF